MIIHKSLLNSLSEKAKASDRLLIAYELRTSPNDNSQRMLNALELRTVMPIHRHRSSSENMVLVKGKLIERFYNEDGSLKEEFVMSPCGEHPFVQRKSGQLHSLEVLESGTIIFETKD